MWVTQLLLWGVRRLRQDSEDVLGVVHAEFVCFDGSTFLFLLGYRTAEELLMHKYEMTLVVVFQSFEEYIVAFVEAPNNSLYSMVKISDGIIFCLFVVVSFDGRNCMAYLIFFAVGDSFYNLLWAVVASVFIGLVPKSWVAMFRNEDFALTHGCRNING